MVCYFLSFLNFINAIFAYYSPNKFVILFVILIILLCIFPIFSDDVEILYVTPAAAPQAEVLSAPSITPRTRLKMARVVQPSKYLLPPYCQIVSTEKQDIMHEQVIKHHKDNKASKIKEYIQISLLLCYSILVFLF